MKTGLFFTKKKKGNKHNSCWPLYFLKCRLMGFIKFKRERPLYVFNEYVQGAFPITAHEVFLSKAVLKKSLFHVQPVAKIVASWATAKHCFPRLLIFWLGKNYNLIRFCSHNETQLTMLLINILLTIR